MALKGFPLAARAALQDSQLRANLARATSTIRDKRGRVVDELPDWEELRAAGAAIKDAALLNLDRHLIQLEASVHAREGPCTGRKTALRRARSSPRSPVRTASKRS